MIGERNIMGFMDIFRKKSKVRALLDAPQNSDVKVEVNEGKVKVFPKRNGKDIEYDIKMESVKGNINIGTFYNRTNTENKSFKDIVGDIQGIIDAVQTAKRGEELEMAKQLANEKLQAISAHYIKLEEDIVKYIEEYEPKNIEYSTLDKFPKVIDVTKMTAEEIIEYGEQLSGRLNKLDSIKTPDDAYEDRVALIGYMKEKEDMIQVAKNMEQSNDNEDGVLYAAYLKLQEKRILKRIRDVMSKYIYNSDIQTVNEGINVNKSVKHIDEEMKNINGGLSSNMLGFIIKSLKEEDKESYEKKYKDKDIELCHLIQSEYDLEEEDKKEILKFLSTRIRCSGQLYLKSGSDVQENSFRNYVANTSFKDKDDNETKEFLYLIAQIEKENIKTVCKPIVDMHDEKSKKTNKKDSSFKDGLHYAIKPIPVAKETENEGNIKPSIDYEKADE